MELNKKEKYIKQVIENQEFNLDTHALWEAIEDRVPVQEKPSRRGFFWIFLPFLLGALIVTGIWIFTAQSTLEILNRNIDEKDKHITTTENAVDVNTQLQQSEEGKIGKSTNEDEKVEAQTIMASEPSPSVVSEEVSPSIATEITNATSTIQSLVRNSKKLTPSTFENPLLELNTQVQVGKTQLSPVLPNNTPVLAYSKKTMSMMPTLSQKALSFPIDQRLVNISGDIWTKDFDLLDDEVRGWSIACYAGPSFTYSSYEGGSDELKEQFLKETNLPGYALSLGLEKGLRRGYYIRSSAGMSSQYTRYQNHEEVINTGEVSGISEIYDLGEQGEELTTANVLTQNSIDFDVKWHRVHRQYDLALFLGKYLKLSEQLGLNVELGANANLVQQHSGYYLADQTKPYVLFKQGEDHPFSSKFRINPVVGLGLDWACSDQMTIGLYGSGNLIPISLIQATSNYQIKNFQLNTQLVVKRNISWKK